MTVAAETRALSFVDAVGEAMRQAMPAPTASGGPPPTMAFAPSMPLPKSAMCIEPPLPLHSPSARP